MNPSSSKCDISSRLAVDSALLLHSGVVKAHILEEAIQTLWNYYELVLLYLFSCEFELQVLR